MDENTPAADARPQARPGYEIHLYRGQRYYAAVLLQVGYERGRRRVLARRTLPLPPPPADSELPALQEIGWLTAYLAGALRQP